LIGFIDVLLRGLILCAQAVALGGVLMLAGILLCLTVSGAIIGSPLAILGFLLARRACFRSAGRKPGTGSHVNQSLTRSSP
jgi:hypothetical protein